MVLELAEGGDDASSESGGNRRRRGGGTRAAGTFKEEQDNWKPARRPQSGVGGKML